ncbi:class B sortase [Finegoldia magna]|uniref:Putative sortase family protein n=1 Tax=Finegoldia magna (strain ATCC 29328 / DSM 20472 / WAL 2508) TaxID=334413 RepID=B0S4K8_FINM2|nr:class B sortase [Finegoldia magna]UEA71120.1 class B sortase [Finegoldia magna]BAG09199.1 putative sortase family protein [Finegoldia magna ATCC 29328]
MFKKILISLILSILIIVGLYNAEQFVSNVEDDKYIKKTELADFKKPENLKDISFNKTSSIIDNDALTKANKDYIGWLTIEGTNINTPVVKSDFYFRKNFKKKYSLAGTPFIPKYNPESNIKSIFGHNLGYGRTDAFHDITNYSDKNYYNSHQTVYFTENKVKGNKYKVVAFLNYSTENKFNYLDVNFKTSKDFVDWKLNIKNLSKYTDENFENIQFNNGKILILSTCHSTTWSDDGIRSVLICYSPERLKNINIDYYNSTDL